MNRLRAALGLAEQALSVAAATPSPPSLHALYSRALRAARKALRDSGSDPQGGDALAAPGEASQSGGAEGDASPNPLINQETPHAR